MRDCRGPVVPLKARVQELDEGDTDLRVEELELGEDDEDAANTGSGKCLPEEFGSAREAEIAAVDDLGVVVGETDGSVSEGGADGNPDERITGIGPENGGQKDGDDDEDSTHSGCAGFLLVRLGAVLADVLADLKLAELLNDVGPDENSDEQGRERGEDRAESEIAEDPEWVEERKELFVEQPVKQEVSNAGSGTESG